MERYNFRNIERKWGSKNTFKNVSNDQAKKNIIVLKCFLILQGKFTWVM